MVVSQVYYLIEKRIEDGYLSSLIILKVVLVKWNMKLYRWSYKFNKFARLRVRKFLSNINSITAKIYFS